MYVCFQVSHDKNCPGKDRSGGIDGKSVLIRFISLLKILLKGEGGGCLLH